MSVLEQLNTLRETGTEAEVRQFVIDHFGDLPEEMQETFAVDFFKEAMTDDIKQRKMITDMQKQVVEAIDDIEAEEKNN